MNNYKELSQYQYSKPVEYVDMPQPVPQPVPQPFIKPPKKPRRKLRIFLLIALGIFIGIAFSVGVLYITPVLDSVYSNGFTLGTLYTQSTGMIKFTDGTEIKEVALESYCQNLNK